MNEYLLVAYFLGIYTGIILMGIVFGFYIMYKLKQKITGEEK